MHSPISIPSPLVVAAIAAFAIAALPSSHGAPEVGAAAPDFTLVDSKGQSHSLSDFKGKFVVLEWLNHGCPFVKKHYESNNMQSLQKEFTAADAVWLSICSSAEGKQGHMTPEEANTITAQVGAAPSAVLLDTDGAVGRLYDAKVTPQMFLIDPEGILLYNGAIDDKKSTDAGDVEGAKNFLKVAFEEAKAGKPVSEPVTTPYGCSVKY